MRSQFAIVLALIPIVFASCARQLPKPQPTSAIFESECAHQLGERRLMAARSLGKWYSHQEEGGAARTPLFIELRNESFWQALLAQLALSHDKNARIAVMSAGMDQAEGLYRSLTTQIAWDITRTQLAQTRFEVVTACLLQDLTARDDPPPIDMHESAVVEYPHEALLAAQNRAARAQEVVDLAAARIAEMEPVEDWMGALGADAIERVLRSRLALEKTLGMRLAVAYDVQKQCERLSKLVAATKRDSSSEAASRWIMHTQLKIECDIESIRQHGYAHKDIRNTLTNPELIDSSEMVIGSFNVREEGAAEETLSWIALRSRWATKTFNCQLAAANNIEAQISAVEAYRALVRHCDSRVTRMTKDRELASAIWRYHLADVEFERSCIEYAPVN